MDEVPAPATGKENVASVKALFSGSEILCPVSTSTAVAIVEQPELRAYKLGKQKCSYNQVELLITNVGGSDKVSDLKVSEAIETVVGNEVDELLRESCLKFNVRLINNSRIHLYIYVVYASPYCSVPGPENQTIRYFWVPVTRSKCRKGCTGPVIRGLQRFGRMSRRGGADGDQDSWKEPRHLYIAIDEASTHVCPRSETSNFRLLVAAYDEQHRLLGTTVSSCIRVMANNDAPLGAASFKLHCHIKGVGRPPSPPTRPGVIDRSSCGRIPLQDIRQIGPSKVGPKALKSDAAVASHVDSFPAGEEITMRKFQDAVTTGDSELQNSLDALCQRIFTVCSSEQEGVISLRKISTILGAKRNLVLDIFYVLESVGVVEEQSTEIYIWLGNSRIQSVLEKPKTNAESSLSTDKAAIKLISKQFCKLFLANEDGHVHWDDAVEAILDKQQFHHGGSTYEFNKSILFKVACILSALHLIAMKQGTVFEWIGPEGVTQHLTAASRPMMKRCQSLDFHKTSHAKRKRSGRSEGMRCCVRGELIGTASADEVPGHYSPGRGDTSFHHGITCANPGKETEQQSRKRMKDLESSYPCDPDEESVIMQRADIDRTEVSTGDRFSAASTLEVSRTERDPSSLQSCEKSINKFSYGISSVDPGEDVCGEWNPGDTSNYPLPSMHSVQPLAQLLTDKQPEGKRASDQYNKSSSAQIVDGHFDPLAHLLRLFTPQEVVALQRHNSAFLFNFVRYYRQLYHMFLCKSTAPGVALPLPRRFYRPSDCNFINVANRDPCGQECNVHSQSQSPQFDNLISFSCNYARSSYIDTSVH